MLIYIVSGLVSVLGGIVYYIMLRVHANIVCQKLRTHVSNHFYHCHYLTYMKILCTILYAVDRGVLGAVHSDVEICAGGGGRGR